MFWKLLKYEFKNVNRWYLAIYGAILVVSLGIGLFLRNMAEKIGLTGDIFDRSEAVQSAEFAFIILLFMILVGLAVALSISTFFLIIRRFKRSVYDRQGYLTLTLPVTQHQIILSKLTAAIIWSFFSLLTLVISFSMITLLVATKTSNFDWGLLSPSSLEYGNILLYALYMLMTSISSTLLIYLSISIGQLFEDHRTALAFLSYFVISILISIVSLRIEPSFSGFSLSILYSIIFNFALALAYYAGTYYILKNKVNLQ